MIWVWNFILYSFFGFLAGGGLRRATGGRGDRKSLLVLPLCPVYGVGAWPDPAAPADCHPESLYAVPAWGAGGTAAEYGMAILYERGLGVSFWDYTGLPGSIQGKICSPFPWPGGAGPPTHLLRPSGGGAADRPDPAWGDLDGGRHGGSGHGGVWGADEGDWEPGLSAVVSKAGGKGTGGWLTAP